MADVYGDYLTAPSEALPELEDIRAFRSDYAVALKGSDGGGPSLLVSTLPLRAGDDGDDLAPIDLSLEADGAAYSPANSLVEVKLPQDISDGIRLPGIGVTVDLRSQQDAEMTAIDGVAGIYPNVSTDSDLAIVPTPTGFETFFEIRSEEGPQKHTYDLTLPAGAHLEETDMGGAVVSDGGQKLLEVRPPTATDAGGNLLPASLTTDEMSMTVTVDPPSDAQYPLLVDPIFESYYWDWYPPDHSPEWIGWATPGFSSDWHPTKGGPLIQAWPGPTSPGNQGSSNFIVPRFYSDFNDPSIGAKPTSYIKEIRLGDVEFHWPGDNYPTSEVGPYAAFGLWSESKSAWVSIGTRTGPQGPMAGASIAITNPAEVTDGKNAGVILITNESWIGQARWLRVGMAEVELSDKDSPAFGQLTSPPTWVDDKVTPVTYKVTDPGLGVFDLQVEQPVAVGLLKGQSVAVGCAGSARSPCPRTLTNATKQIPYEPGLMPQGENWLRVWARDPLGQASAKGEFRVNVDHSNPEVSASGTAMDQAALGTELAQYTLKPEPRDGDVTAPTSLAPFGTPGSGVGQLERPESVATDWKTGVVYAVDRVNNRVLKYAPDGSYIGTLGASGYLPGQVNQPRGVAVSYLTGNVWIAEAGVFRRVQAFSRAGEYLRTITSEAFGDPWGIAVSPVGIVWVADKTSRTIFRFKEDGSSLGAVPNTGASGVLSAPRGITVDANETAWIADAGASKVFQFRPTGPTASFGSAGTENGQFTFPQGVAVAASGHVLVSDANRVQVFTPNGTYLRQFGTKGSANGQFSEPSGLAIGPKNTLFVADGSNRRIARWEHADLDRQSGVKKIVISVDNTPFYQQTLTCSAGPCSVPGITLNADAMSVGQHQVSVTATDGVSRESVSNFVVETHGDLTAPSLKLSGSATEQGTVGSTLPRYRLNLAASDPKGQSQRSSGVTSISGSLDGNVLFSKVSSCPAGGCAMSTPVDLVADSLSTGPHQLAVKATDGAGRTSTQILNFAIQPDVTPPSLSVTGELYEAPKGWVQQKVVPVTMSAVDTHGYGVKRLILKLDGAEVGATDSAPCEEGGCPLTTGHSVDLTNVPGGAHALEAIAEDRAGNTTRNEWALNVVPSGTIENSEATETLEAFDATSNSGIVGEAPASSGDEGLLRDASLKFNPVSGGDGFNIPGSGAPVHVDGDPGDGLVILVPEDEVLDPSCELSVASEEESEAAESLPSTQRSPECNSQIGGSEEESFELQPFTIEPIAPAGSVEAPEIEGPAGSVVEANLKQNVDQIVRPLYNGAQTFVAIRDASAPEAFGWKVELEDDQKLISIDSKTVEVRYEGGQRAFLIEASAAHDAIGTELPTSLTVEGSDTLILHVPHKGSSPAGGTYVYPVVGGAGWQGGFRTYEIAMPPPVTYPLPDIPEIQITQTGHNARINIGMFGAPVAVASSSGAGDPRNYPFRFSECRYFINYTGADVPTHWVTPVRRALMETAGTCAALEDAPGSALDDMDFRVGAMVYGTLTMEQGKEIWVDNSPKRIKCVSWGPKDQYGIERRAAVVNCYAKPWKAKTSGITLRGDFRASSLTTGIPGNATCFTPAMAVYPVKPFKELRETHVSLKGEGDQFEPCNWP